MARSPVKGHRELPAGGHGNCPWAVTRGCPVADMNLPTGPPPGVGLGQGGDSLPGECLGQAYGVAVGLAEVGVVQ